MDSFTAADFDLLNDSLGVKFQTATARDRVELSDLESEFARQCVHSALIVVNEGLNILDLNQRARDLLASQHGIEDYGGVFRIKRSSVCRTIARLVHQAAEGATGVDAAADIIGIPDDDGRTRFALRVLPCRYLGVSCALVVINDMLSTSHAPRRVLAKLFSLSAREAEFADCFAAGSRVEQIASDMAISSNTARIHLRHLFMKTGCKTQAELARLFATVPQVLGLALAFLQIDVELLTAVQLYIEAF